MLRDIGGQRVWLCTISSGRPGEVPALESKTGAMTWYVPPTQRHDYEAGHPGAIGLGTNVPARVPEIRNRALNDAWDKGVPCVMLDDDLKRAQRLPAPKVRGEWTETGEGIGMLLADFVTQVSESRFMLGGVPPTNNAYFSRVFYTTYTFVRSHLWMVKPCDLWLDTNLATKFDYDYTLQHIRRYGGIYRADNLVWDFDFGTWKGGHVDTRDRQSEEESIRYLQGKWGSKIVRRHPSRHGEVMIHPPRPSKRRVVLS